MLDDSSDFTGNRDVPNNEGGAVNMKYLRKHIFWLVLATIVGSGVGCSKRGADYIGMWECSSEKGNSAFEIKTNNDDFLATFIAHGEETSYHASLDSKGVLVASMGFLGRGEPLPIDADRRVLICSSCFCKHYKKVKDGKKE